MKKIGFNIFTSYILTGIILGVWYIVTGAKFPWYQVAETASNASWLNPLLKVVQSMFLWGGVVVSDFAFSAGKLTKVMDCALLLVFVVLVISRFFGKANKAMKNADVEQNVN